MRDIRLVENVECTPFTCSHCGEWRTHLVVLAGDPAEAGNNVYYLPCGHGVYTYRALTPEELATALLLAEDY